MLSGPNEYDIVAARSIEGKGNQLASGLSWQQQKKYNKFANQR